MPTAFFAGFMKAAESLTGNMPGLASGLKGMAAPGQIGKAPHPTSGISIAPRAQPSPLPTPEPISTQTATQAETPRARMNKVTVPKPSQGR